MGHPKKQRKKYESPKKPYDKKRIEREKKISVEFGLRRKKEIWRTEGILRDFRQRARSLQANPNNEEQELLFRRLNSLGLNVSSLDDVLSINIETLLSRRLQTILCRKGMANTEKQSRQFIVHGHVRINGRRVRWPGFIVPVHIEDKIDVQSKEIKNSEKKVQ